MSLNQRAEGLTAGGGSWDEILENLSFCMKNEETGGKAGASFAILGENRSYGSTSVSE